MWASLLDHLDPKYEIGEWGQLATMDGCAHSTSESTHLHTL